MDIQDAAALVVVALAGLYVARRFGLLRALGFARRAKKASSRKVDVPVGRLTKKH